MGYSQQPSQLLTARLVMPGHWCLWVYIVTLILVAVVAGLVLSYTYPTGDELCRAVRVSRLGVPAGIAFEYQHWSGRWLSHGLEYAIFAIPSFPQYYGLILASISAVYAVALVAFGGAVWGGGDESRRGGRLLMPLGLFTLYWVGLPSLNDTVYWMTGAVEYQLSMALALFLLAWLLRLSRRLSHLCPMVITGIGALAFAATSMHELLGLLLFVTLLVGSAVALRLGHRVLSAWLVATAGAAVGFAIVYFAPGNEVRIADLEHYGEPLRALRIAAVQALRTFPDWIFDSRLLLATLLVLTHPAFYAIDVDWLRNGHVSWQLVVPGLWLVLMTGLLLGPAWGTGKWIASRALAPLYMVFLLGWFATLLVLVRQGLGTKRPRLPEPRLWFALLLVFSASLVFTGNTRRAINDLLDSLPKWHAAREQRAEQIRASAGQETDVRIGRTAELPYTVGFFELTDDPDDWINRCAADFYGVKSLAYKVLNGRSQ